jgi:potassium efflux system protein
VAFAALVLSAGVAWAQGGTGTDLSPEQVQARVKEVEGTAGLDDSQRSKALDLYRQALGQLESSAASAGLASGYTAAIQSGPREVNAIRDALARPPPPSGDTPTGLAGSTSPGEIEQTLAREQATLAGLQGSLRKLEEELQAQQGRPADAQRELDQARQALAELRERLKPPPAPGEARAVTEAQRVFDQARLAARAADVVRLEQELASYAVRLELLGARRDQAAREVTRGEERVRALESLRSRVQRAEAQEAREKAVAVEEAAAEKDPSIRRVAEANAVASAQVASLLEQTSALRAELEAADAEGKQFEQDLQSARQKLQAAGLTEALGRILVAERVRVGGGPFRRLEQLGRQLGAAGGRQDVLAEVGLAQVQAEEERRLLARVDAAADARLAAEVRADLPSAERAAIRAELLRLLRDRQGLLQQLSAAQGGYLRAYAQLELARERAGTARAAYLAFLEETLLWTPNVPPVGPALVPDLFGAVGLFLSPAGWLEVGGLLLHEVVSRPLALAITVLVFAGLLWAGAWMRRRSAQTGARVGKPLSDRFSFTAEGLAYTVALALPLPLALWLVGWRLTASSAASEFTVGVGNGLDWAAPTVLMVQAFLNLCAPAGVAAVHFQWPEVALRLVRRQLRLLGTVGVPALFVGGFLGGAGESAYLGSLGRLAFITLMVAVALVLQRVLRPDGPVMRAYFAEHAGGWLHRLRRLWYPVTVGLPVVLAALAAAGYLYSAGELALRMVNTWWFIAGMVVLQALVVRWLLVTRRQLALEMARRRRGAGAEGGDGPAEAAALDLAAVDTQTRGLLRAVLLLAAPVGLWLIWADVLPALNLLERVTLWHHEQVVDGQTRLAPVTLEQLVLALLMAIVFAVLARNLPGVLELGVLRYFGLQPGTRYAVRKVTGYAVVAIGVVVVFGALGWSWSNVQWLVAALGVGLGFGLQEIFANFISGLIILFERPVRVGDTVTVGDLSGSVSRIRIRATTITDWDGKEIIVPNKSFITERVVNWTLSDTITRVKTSVGVAYGSDLDLAHRLILDAVRSVPLVLSEPRPQVYFVGFGDSSLNFDIYAFASALGDRLPMTHAIHMAVERALREHGVQIPFPQREVHIRGTPPPAPKTGSDPVFSEKGV